MALPAHTDTTYFSEPVGLQFFHLLEHRGTGGKSLYVDGFNAALKLQNDQVLYALSLEMGF
jgi:trimethyllysine dioxygenase